MLKPLLNFLYPERCDCCALPLDQFEKGICTSCRHNLPLTRFHHFNDPTVKKVFQGRLQLETATSLFYFEKKGPIQVLLHNLKYKGKEHISTALGEWLGYELAQIPSYQSIDYVIPVPLHPKKLRQRGYNQVTAFGKQLANHLNASFEPKVLKKAKHTKTQVFKDRFSRNEAIYDSFELLQSDHLSGKHLLLVDDIITTGATIEACALELLKIPKIKLSVATMAIAV